MASHPSEVQPAVVPSVPVAPVPTASPQTNNLNIVQADVNCNAFRSTFAQYAWDVTTAVAICQAESGGNTHALSTTCDYGLMQINCVHGDMVDGNLDALYDPTTNIRVAYRVYLSQGWHAWTTYTSGRYVSFMNR